MQITYKTEKPNRQVWICKDLTQKSCSSGKSGRKRRKGKAHYPYAYHLVCKTWACVVTSGTLAPSYLLMTWLLTKQQDAFWVVQSNPICSGSTQCLKSNRMAIHKTYCQGDRRLLRWKTECSLIAKAITWLESIKVYISLTEGKIEGKMPLKQAGTGDIYAVNAWQTITREE